MEAVNKVPTDILAEMCQDAVSFLQYKLNVVPHEEYCKHFQRSGVDGDSKLIFNTICYIFRIAARTKLTADKLSDELSASSVWKEPTLSVFKRVWDEQGRVLCSQDLKQVLSVGQLVDIKWKLNIGMSSSCCRSLNAPYIAMVITVADPSGNLSVHSMEMTVTEFKKFSNKIKDMSSVLETV